MADGSLLPTHHPALHARVAIVGAPLWRARLAKRLLAWPGVSLHLLGASGDDLAELFDTAPADRFFLHHLAPTGVRTSADHLTILGASGQELAADLVVSTDAGDSRVITPDASSPPPSGAASADELADEVIGVLSRRSLAAREGDASHVGI